MGCFIGVDLAWNVDKNHSGIAVLEGNEEGARLTQLSSRIHSMNEVMRFIRANLSEYTGIAIDASLIVNNPAGQRPCETEIGRAFARFGASCHSTNRSRPYFDTGGRLVDNLAVDGFVHGLGSNDTLHHSGRWLIEVYPHPAMVRVFNLARIIRYKKGTRDERCAGLRLLRRHLRSLCEHDRGLIYSQCLDDLLSFDLRNRTGTDLKTHEDLLDAVFCAYLAWHFWRWGDNRNDVYGNLATGYIVVPSASRFPNTPISP